jgi:hypothetical protein
VSANEILYLLYAFFEGFWFPSPSLLLPQDGGFDSAGIPFLAVFLHGEAKMKEFR